MVLWLKILPIDSPEKSQTQLSADALIVRLMRTTIVRDIRVATKIALEFPRRSKITENVEVDRVVALFRVRYPMSARSRRIVQIHDTALVTTRSRWKRVAHKHASEERYAQTDRGSMQLFVRRRTEWRDDL